VNVGGGADVRSCEEVVLERALGDLADAATRVEPMGEARDRLGEAVNELSAAVRPRADYRLIHGELGPDRVPVDDQGEPVLIDIEGLMFFDVEWEHTFLQLRFGEHDRWFRRGHLDEARMRFYRLAMHLSLVAGPLRLLDGTSRTGKRCWASCATTWSGRSTTFGPDAEPDLRLRSCTSAMPRACGTGGQRPGRPGPARIGNDRPSSTRQRPHRAAGSKSRSARPFCSHTAPLASPAEIHELPTTIFFPQSMLTPTFRRCAPPVRPGLLGRSAPTLHQRMPGRCRSVHARTAGDHRTHGRRAEQHDLHAG
jgi:hypothetical protein